MRLLLILSWRNIRRHRGRSLAIGSIIFLGALVITAGNGLLSGFTTAIHKNIVDVFSGQIAIVSEKQEIDDVFFDMSGKPVEPIYNFKAIKQALEPQPCIKRLVPYGKNLSLVLNESTGSSTYIFLLGIDPDRCRDMYPEIGTVVQGRRMARGESGVEVNKESLDGWVKGCGMMAAAMGSMPDTLLLSPEFRKASLKYPTVRELVFTGIGANGWGADIRVPIRGIVSYNRLKMYNLFAAVDIRSFRRCMGYADTVRYRAPLSTEDSMLLRRSKAGLDSMFTGNIIVGLGGNGVAKNESPSAIASIPAAGPAHPATDTCDPDDGAYNIISVILEKNSSIAGAVKSINRVLTKKKCRARAIPWTRATGTVGDLVKLLKFGLFMSVTVLFIVAIILFINTLIMSVLERKEEIGMMRALGAQKGFAAALFGFETALLAGLSGGLGIIAGVILIALLRFFNCIPTNMYMEAFFGAERLRPVLSATDILLVTTQLIVTILVSAAYPMLMTRNIRPLDAMKDSL